MGDMLDDVRFARMELQDIIADVDWQIEELGEFVTGRRTSIYPLGRVLLTKLGVRLDELRRELEYRLADVN